MNVIRVHVLMVYVRIDLMDTSVSALMVSDLYLSPIAKMYILTISAAKCNCLITRRQIYLKNVLYCLCNYECPKFFYDLTTCMYVCRQCPKSIIERRDKNSLTHY